MKFKKMSDKRRTGFTLIELLIVIAIIGILAGVILAVIDPAKQRTRSQQGTARGLVSKACAAMEACNNATSNGTCVTATVAELVPGFAWPTYVTANTISAATISATVSGCTISCDTATGVITLAGGASCVIN